MLHLIPEKYVNSLFMVNTLATVAPRTVQFDEKNRSACVSIRRSARAVWLAASITAVGTMA